MIICPKCPGKLEQLQINGITLDYCSSCEGLWFDENELKKTIESDTFSINSKIKASSFDGKEIVGPIKELILSRPCRCPKCKDHPELERKVFEKNETTLYTDNCKKCNGVWLDGGELKVLRNTFFAEITNKNDFFKRIADFILRN